MKSILQAVSDMNPEASTNGGITGQKLQVIPLTDCSKISASLDTLDFVENLLGIGGFSVVYGSSNVGKSFWVLDLATHIASKKKYRDTIAVDGGAVIYVTLEGQASFDNRIAALKSSGKLTRPGSLYVVKVPIDLLNGVDAARLIEAIKDIHWIEPVQLVVVDTLSRAMAGGEENGTVDMMTVVKSVDRIREETGTHVMLVHHCGKDEAKGARGSTCLRAAIDTEIEISRAEGADQRIVRVKKQRDLEIVPPMAFTLETVHLGKNGRGKPVTSCIVRHETDATIPFFQSTGFKKTKPAPSHEAVQNLVPENGRIHKKLLLKKIRQELNATHLDAESVVMEMIAVNSLSEVTVKSSRGQNQLHITRNSDTWA